MAHVSVTVNIDEDAASAIATLLGNMNLRDYERLATSPQHEQALRDLYEALGDRFEWTTNA